MPRERTTRRDPAENSPGRPNSLGIHQRQLDSLLDRVDHARDSMLAPKRRRYVRWPFRQETILLKISHPGGTIAAVKVACRNLSHGGISILHSAFIYPGSRCAVSIPHPTRGELSARGEVVRCIHLHRMIHEIGIRFDELVDVREFIPVKQRDGKFAVETLEPEDIFGRIICADAPSIDLKLVEHFILRTRAVVSVATLARRAASLASRGCDLAVLGMDLPDASLPEAVRKIRDAAGHELPVIVIADKRQRGLDRMFREARINALLIKPLTETSLLRALGEFLIHSSQSQRGRGGDGLAAEPAVRLGLFIAELAGTIPRLERAADDYDAMGCYVLCQQVLGAAPTAGLQTLAKLADAASDQLATTMSLEQSRQQIDSLIAACRSAIDRSAA